MVVSNMPKSMKLQHRNRGTLDLAVQTHMKSKTLLVSKNFPPNAKKPRFEQKQRSLDPTTFQIKMQMQNPSNETTLQHTTLPVTRTNRISMAPPDMLKRSLAAMTSPVGTLGLSSLMGSDTLVISLIIIMDMDLQMREITTTERG